MEPHALAEILAILPMFDRDLVVQHLAVAKTGIDLFAHVAGPHADCPTCETRSHRVHGRYFRRLADLAWQGTPVRVHLQVRRFCCLAASCPRQTFAERLPTFAPPHARRTARLTDLVTRVGLALGGEAGARLLPTLGTTSSADTVLRLVRRAPVPPVPTPRVLGVDEWARRRGHTYGTVLVDLERRRPVALLDDRSAESFADWLRAHPGVEVITRDRSEIYAEGARRGAPVAVQVADRWHLLKNVGEVVERVLHRHRAALEVAAQQTRASDPDGEATEVAARAPLTTPALASPGQRTRQASYERIQALHAEGRSLHAITREVEMSRATVRKYLRAPECPTRAARRTKIGAFTAFEGHLQTRWQQGCRDAVQLWRELQALGFGGTYRAVQRHVARWRPAGRRRRGRAAAGPRGGARTKTPSPRQVRWWLVLPEARLSDEQRRYISTLTAATAAIRSAQELAVEFGRVLREHDTAALGPWMAQAGASELAEFRDFFVGLRRDQAAVQAAVAESWSNGQTEGQVNKIKMLKRQMYGRASVALLSQRLLLAA